MSRTKEKCKERSVLNMISLFPPSILWGGRRCIGPWKNKLWLDKLNMLRWEKRCPFHMWSAANSYAWGWSLMSNCLIIMVSWWFYFLLLEGHLIAGIISFFYCCDSLSFFLYLCFFLIQSPLPFIIEKCKGKRNFPINEIILYQFN